MRSKDSLLRGRGSGKVLTEIVHQVFDEVDTNPPANLEEAAAFCRIQTKRCNVNLANAKDRGDKRAIIHLERKLAVYGCLSELVAKAQSCPSCLVHSMAEEDEACPCCGYVRKKVE